MPCVLVVGFDDSFGKELRKRKRINDILKTTDDLLVVNFIALASELAHHAFPLLKPTAKIVEDSDEIKAELGFTPLD